MGGNNDNQTIEYVRSFDPRSWSCLHVDEGALACNNVLVQNNDVGPCGSDKFQQWADGVSISCRNTIVRNNMVQGPTDGGIVLFGSPGSQVYNNTIWILNVCFVKLLLRGMVLTSFQNTLLGGINMVDYEPWLGNYTGTTVYNNTILGGFANENVTNGSKGVNAEDAIIKYVLIVIPRIVSQYRLKIESVSPSDLVHGSVTNTRTMSLEMVSSSTTSFLVPLVME